MFVPTCTTETFATYVHVAFFCPMNTLTKIKAATWTELHYHSEKKWNKLAKTWNKLQTSYHTKISQFGCLVYM